MYAQRQGMAEGMFIVGVGEFDLCGCTYSQIIEKLNGIDDFPVILRFRRSDRDESRY